MLEYSTPSSGGHAGGKVHRTDGATTNFERGSPASSGGYSHYTTSFNGSQRGAGHDVFPPRPTLRSPYFNSLLPDWDSRQVIPKPLDSFTARLAVVPKFNDKPCDMKVVNNMWKTFKRKFSGEKGESWTKHLDSLETEVFEANSLVPKQCYYAIRKTLTGYALKTIVAMEWGTEKSAWPKCVPS